MANFNNAHLHREIESLRKQLIQERDQRQFEDSLRITTVIKEAEARMLERCIVECMEEANAPTYTEEERIAILTAAERLKERRDERLVARQKEEAEKRQIKEKEYQSALYQQMMDAKVQALQASMLTGKSIHQMWIDENADVKWNKPMNPKEWMK